jgi:Domain of unknown function (DUF4412)
MTIAWTLAATLALAPLPATAPGVYYEQVTIPYSDGKPSGPGVVSRVWCAGKRMRLEPGESRGGPAFILRLDTKAAYRIEPLERRAVAIDVERLRARSQVDLSMAGDLMGADTEGSARTRALGASRTIAGFPCEGYRLTTGSTVMDVYVTRSLGIGVETFADFLEWSGASQALGGLMTEIRRLPGFPLETRSKVTVLGEVQETRSTVTKVLVGPQPLALFEPPAGYAVVPEEAGAEE